MHSRLFIEYDRRLKDIRVMVRAYASLYLSPRGRHNL